MKPAAKTPPLSSRQRRGRVCVVSNSDNTTRPVGFVKRRLLMAMRIAQPILVVLMAISAFAIGDTANAQRVYVATPAGVYVRPYPPVVAYPYGYPYNPRRAYRQAVRSSYYAAAAAATYAVPPAPYAYPPRNALPRSSTGTDSTRGPRDYLYSEPSESRSTYNQPTENRSMTPTPAPPRPSSTLNAPSSSSALKPMTPQSGNSTEAIPSPPSEPGPVEF
jgi:hypothetical protein